MEERWAAVEIMGHRQHVGRISEETFAGATLLRVDALRSDGSVEVVRYGGAAIFSLRDVTEEQARASVTGRGSMLLPARAEIDEDPPTSRRITCAEDFEAWLGDVIDGDMMSGVLGLDDEGHAPDGAQLLTLLLNDDAGTRIPLRVGGEEVPRG